jgi:hypothetical protein
MKIGASPSLPAVVGFLDAEADRLLEPRERESARAAMERALKLRLDPTTSLRYFTPQLLREATTAAPGGNPPGNRSDGPQSGAVVSTEGKSVLSVAKPAFPDRYLKAPSGAVIAAEHIPPEDWIIQARRYRDHGTWPSTLGPPARTPGSSCPPEFAREAT